MKRLPESTIPVAVGDGPRQIALTWTATLKAATTLQLDVGQDFEQLMVLKCFEAPYFH